MAKNTSTKGSKKKSTPKKKSTGGKTAPASADAASPDEKPVEREVASEPVTAPLSVSELVLKKFDGWNPPRIFVPPAVETPVPGAPPFVSAADPQEADRMAALLFRTFDLKAEIARYETEKAEAERIAAEKAEAERIAAEKAEAERIAAEKAEAERIAAEKAEAARVFADQCKKATKAQQAEIAKLTVTALLPPFQDKKPEPTNSAVKLAAGCLGLLIILLLGFSFSNSGKYYIQRDKNGIEIWQGRFAPEGKKLLISLSGVVAPKTLCNVCTQNDVYPVIFNYYLSKADAIIKKPGIPDFDGIRHMIALARSYAVTSSLQNKAALRLNRLEQAMLEYKADIAAGRGGISNLKAALDLLDKAKALNAGSMQTRQLDKKIAAVTAQLLKSPTTPTAK